MKYFFRIVVGFLLVMAMGACSSGDKTVQEQATPEKSAVKRFTDETAEKMEKKIRTPLDKAKATGALNDERTDAMDQALQQSTGKQ